MHKKYRPPKQKKTNKKKTQQLNNKNGDITFQIMR